MVKWYDTMDLNDWFMFERTKENQKTILGRVRLLYDYFNETIQDDEVLLTFYERYFGLEQRYGNEDSIKRLGRALRQRYNKQYVRHEDMQHKQEIVNNILHTI